MRYPADHRPPVSAKEFLLCFESLPPLVRDHRGSAGHRCRGGFGVAKHVNPVVDLFLELVFVDEAVDLHGAEEVADAFADAALGNFSCRIGQ